MRRIGYFDLTATQKKIVIKKLSHLFGYSDPAGQYLYIPNPSGQFLYISLHSIFTKLLHILYINYGENKEPSTSI